MTLKNHLPAFAITASVLAMAAFWIGAAGAQTEEPAEQPQEASDAYEAYEAGLYEQALEEFVDRQVERPEDPELDLNIGSVHYQRKDYESAKTNYARAARQGDELLRAEALYNLGNTAYREGKLKEAIDYYMSSLDLNPDDEDAKYNLEFVREEIKRRQEEQQQRQDQQQNQEQQQQDQQNENQGGGEQDQNEGGDQDQQSQDQQQGDSGDQDQDGDGIPDDVERLGQNPTDPQNPDTDGDGKPDGEEDANQNGQVDPGESDPNTPDGEGQGQGQQGQESPREGQMTPEQAARYLQALEERQPDKARRGKKAKVVRAEKDW